MQKVLIVIFISLIAWNSNAQKFGKNIPSFQYRNWHFGTMLGTNTTSYNVQFKDNPFQYDSVSNINIESRPGMAIHIPLVSYNAHETFHFRFLSSISFHETNFNYAYYEEGRLKRKQYRTEPVYLNFPLFVKVNTKRINNFSAYALGGAGYSLDLASQKDVEQSVQSPILKLKQHDWQYHVGGGFDFYLPYFKLGLEIKTTRGITNIMIQDNTFFSSPIESLKSRMWWFSITFEG
ncbi:MAG: outer membrane beta-barrel protein [Crocinitomicaceae bacterium]